jgi:CRISPR/Cas system-associated endoribonuclease Cas2
MFISKEKHERLMQEVKHAHDKRVADLLDQIKRKDEKLLGMSTKLDEERALAFKTMELDFKEKFTEEVNALKSMHAKELERVKNSAQEEQVRAVEKNYEKLRDSLAKLHEEGNANTKYLEQMTLKMLGNMKLNSQHKQLENK